MIFERDAGIELAFAVLPLAEGIGQLGDPQAVAGRDHDVEQDLEALGRELRRDLARPARGAA